MVLAPCTECGHNISSKASTCPQCGARPSKAKRWLCIIVFALAVVVGIPFFVGLASSSPEAKERLALTLAIEDCWKQQKQPTNDTATASFIAGSCEILESRYEKKYGRKP